MPKFLQIKLIDQSQSVRVLMHMRAYAHARACV